MMGDKVDRGTVEYSRSFLIEVSTREVSDTVDENTIEYGRMIRGDKGYGRRWENGRTGSVGTILVYC